MEQVNNKQRTPNWFTAKELDEDTGYYYFGARYYDPRMSVWISADPALGKFLPARLTRDNPRPDLSLPGLGGVYKTQNLAAYAYSQLNPVRLSDPDGNATEAERKFAVAVAQEYVRLGTPYVLGGKGDPSSGGCDCSGLTANAFSGLPAGTKAQFKGTSEVPINSVIPGDLIFFDTNPEGTVGEVGGHVGIVTDLIRDKNNDVSVINFIDTANPTAGPRKRTLGTSQIGQGGKKSFTLLFNSVRTFDPGTDPPRPGLGDFEGLENLFSGDPLPAEAEMD